MGSHDIHPELFHLNDDDDLARWPDDDHQDGAVRGLGLALLWCLAFVVGLVALGLLPFVLAVHWWVW